MGLSCLHHRVGMSIKECVYERFACLLRGALVISMNERRIIMCLFKGFFFLYESPGKKWILPHEKVWLHISARTAAAAAQYVGSYTDYCFLIKREIGGTQTAHLSRDASGWLRSVLPGVSASLRWLRESWEDKHDTASSSITNFSLCCTAWSMRLPRDEVQPRFPQQCTTVTNLCEALWLTYQGGTGGSLGQSAAGLPNRAHWLCFL